MSWTTTTADDGIKTNVTINWPYVINTGSFSGMMVNFSGAAVNFSGMAFNWSGIIIGGDAVAPKKEKPPEIEKAPELDRAFAKRNVARVFRKMGLPG